MIRHSVRSCVRALSSSHLSREAGAVALCRLRGLVTRGDAAGERAACSSSADGKASQRGGGDAGSYEEVAPPVVERSNDIKVGDILQLDKVFTYADVAQYGALTADFNPIHMDVIAAKQAGFSNLVVHGMLCSSLFPAAIARRYPGAVYISQTLRFVAPALVNEPLRAQLEITTIADHKGRKRVTFSTKCFRRGTALVILGDAMALIPSTAIENSRTHLGSVGSNCPEEEKS